MMNDAAERVLKSLNFNSSEKSAAGISASSFAESSSAAAAIAAEPIPEAAVRAVSRAVCKAAQVPGV